MNIVLFADRAYPYEGSKTLMTVAEDVENTELMEAVLTAMYEELPEPKKKVNKTKKKKDGQRFARIIGREKSCFRKGRYS